MSEIYIISQDDNFGSSRVFINNNFVELFSRANVARDGLDWQESVLAFTELALAIPNDGNRYVATQDDTSINHSWTKDNIYEWSTELDDWYEVEVAEGFCVFVEDIEQIYIYSNSSWNPFGSLINHNVVPGLQGGAVTEYYHLTGDEHNRLVNYGDAQPLHYHDEEASGDVIDDTSIGTKQEWKYADGYFHQCVATNTWVRTPVETVFTT